MPVMSSEWWVFTSLWKGGRKRLSWSPRFHYFESIQNISVRDIYKENKREIYESRLEADRWKQTISRGFFYSFESSNFPKRRNMSMPIQKYPTIEQELYTSPRRLHPINNFGFKLKPFNQNSRGEKRAVWVGQEQLKTISVRLLWKKL